MSRNVYRMYFTAEQRIERGRKLHTEQQIKKKKQHTHMCVHHIQRTKKSVAHIVTAQHCKAPQSPQRMVRTVFSLRHTYAFG